MRTTFSLIELPMCITPTMNSGPGLHCLFVLVTEMSSLFMVFIFQLYVFARVCVHNETVQCEEMCIVWI